MSNGFHFDVRVLVNGQRFDGDQGDLFANWTGLELSDVLEVQVVRGHDEPMTRALGVPGEYMRAQWEIAVEIAGALNTNHVKAVA